MSKRFVFRVHFLSKVESTQQRGKILDECHTHTLLMLEELLDFLSLSQRHSGQAIQQR